MRHRIAIFVLALGAAASSAEQYALQRLDLPTHELAFNRADGLFYASVASRRGADAHAVAVLDPQTAAVVRTLPLSGEATSLSLSGDGRFLYCIVPSAGAVERLRLPEGQVDETLTFGDDPWGGPWQPAAIAALPTSPESVAVVLTGKIKSSGNRAVIYDGTTPRPQVIHDVVGVPDDLLFPNLPASLFPGNNWSGQGRWIVDAAGLHGWTDDGYTGPRERTFQNGLIYNSDGFIVRLTPNPVAPNGYNLVRPARSVAAEPETDRVYFIRPDTWNQHQELLAYYQHTGVPAATLELPEVAAGNVDARQLQRWGADGLAFRTTDDHVYFLRSSFLVPQQKPGVDLSVSISSRSARVRAGAKLRYSVTVTNRGKAPASDVTLEVASSPLVVDETGYGLPGWSIKSLGNLAPGASVTATYVGTPVTLPSTTLTARASSNELELQPEDNLAARSVSVLPALKPDLTLAWEGLQRIRSKAGDRLKGTLVIRNLGAGRAGKTEIRLSQSRLDYYVQTLFADLGPVKAPSVGGLKTVRLDVDLPLPHADWNYLLTSVSPSLSYRGEAGRNTATLPPL